MNQQQQPIVSVSGLRLTRAELLAAIVRGIILIVTALGMSLVLFDNDLVNLAIVIIGALAWILADWFFERKDTVMSDESVE
jgi:hypothetical protein